jgi:isoprenylcysteine carboxyl methyltransferase (ICMT) family protein YpbQ
VIEFGSVQFDSGAALLAFITLQRIAELWWAKQNERRLFAAGGVEYGRSHLLLIVLFHAAWLIGMWAGLRSSDRAAVLDHCGNLANRAVLGAGVAGRFALLSSRGKSWWREVLTDGCVTQIMRW